MNPLLLASPMILLAGGIDGNKHLDNSERWGVTFAGLGIVIAALALLVVIIFLFGKIFEAINAKQKAKETAIAEQKKPKNAPPVKKAPAPAAAKSNPVNPASPANPASVEDEEVIAVISAVVAMMSEQDGKTYTVKSVKTVPKNQGFSNRSAWAMDGRRQNVSPF